MALVLLKLSLLPDSVLGTQQDVRNIHVTSDEAPQPSVQWEHKGSAREIQRDSCVWCPVFWGWGMWTVTNQSPKTLLTKDTQPLAVSKQRSFQTCCCPFGANLRFRQKKLPSEAQVGHLFCSSPVCEGLFLSEKFTQQPPQDVSHFWWLKGTCWVWRREPLIYFHHFSLADSYLREKEQARSLICLLGMPGSHGSPDRGHLFRSQPLQTHTKRGCLKGCAPTLLWRTVR